MDNLIDYTKIPFREKRSTGEHVIKNSFYLPRTENNEFTRKSYSDLDFFGIDFFGLEMREENDNE